MTVTELDHLDSLAELATPGPWVKTNGKGGLTTPARKMLGLTNADSAFLAAVRTAAPQLTAEVRRLRAVLAEVDGMTGDPAIRQTIEVALGEAKP